VIAHVAGAVEANVQACRRCGAVLAEWTSVAGFLSGTGPPQMWWIEGEPVTAFEDRGQLARGTVPGAAECADRLKVRSGPGAFAQAVARAKKGAR
jgi:hypothetical protein